ncbi:hypothetical protein GCM10017767_19640 [Halomonas urumqiensis]|nr:hypothetical protein GCM10017767_19640 [Halomonas urumqiensis]
MVFDHEADYPSQWAAIGTIASRISCTPETLRSWFQQAEREALHYEQQGHAMNAY